MMISLCVVLVVLKTAYTHVYRPSKNIIAQLPDRLGAPESLGWCENGVTSALPRVIDTLLSHKIKMGAAKLLVNKFEQHFDQETGDMIIPPNEWAKLECVPHNGRYVASAPAEWPFVPDPTVAHITGNPQAPDEFCEILWHFGEGLLANDTLPEPDATSNPFLKSDEMLGIHLSKLQLANVVPPSLIPPEVAPYLHLEDWSVETLVAVAKIIPSFQRFFDFPEGAPLKTRMALFADTMCRFSDVEATVPGLHDSTPFTCAVVDTLLASLMCTGVAAVPRKDAVCKPSTTRLTIKEFPTATCYPPRSTFQRQGPYREELRAFKWDDEGLFIPLELEDLRPLPTFVPKSVRTAELLTYLALFRASMLIYPAVDDMLCVDDLPENFELIPGWTVMHIFSIQLPRDPMFEVDPLHNHLPMMFLSQSTRDSCHFNIAVRGTASRLEWLLDFNYWAAPLAAPDGTKGGKHQGYTDIVNTLVGYIRGALERLSQHNGCNCETTKLLIHGHSLGGGVGQLLALHLGIVYSEELSCNLRVDGVFFASPRVMVDAALTRYRDTVNGRHLIDLSDPLYHLPCHTENARLGFARCGREHVSLPGMGRDEYGENDGRILLDVDFERAGANLTVNHIHRSVDPPYVTDVEIHEMVELAKRQETLREQVEQQEADPIEVQEDKWGSYYRAMEGVNATVVDWERSGALYKARERSAMNLGTDMFEQLSAPRSQFRAVEFAHDLRHDDERAMMRDQILFDATLDSSSFSRFTKRIITAAVNFVVPNSVMKLIPTKGELAAAHVASFGCALSVACHGLPWAEFRWWCNGLPNGVIDL